MNIRNTVLFLCTFTLASCVESSNTTVSRNDPRILAMGDSLMAAHRISGRAISDAVALNLNEPVKDRSVVGARLMYALPITGAMGLNISQQYRGDTWDWVVVNGGGNDLWLGCGCHSCDGKMEKLISADGTSGKIPSLVGRLRSTGAQVLWVGYLRSPGLDSPIEGCREEGDELEARISEFAKRTTGMHFLSIADLVPYGDTSFHGIDRIHPSLKASKAIGERVSTYIRKVDPKR